MSYIQTHKLDAATKYSSVSSLYRYVCVPAPPGVFLSARVSRVSRVCPGSPRCLFTGTPIHPNPPWARGTHLARGPQLALKATISVVSVLVPVLGSHVS